MFAELKANKALIVKAKKSEVKRKPNNFALRPTEAIKNLNVPDGKIKAVISNTNYIDSHDDVHLDGSMSKTASEQQNKVYYVADHKLEVSNVIAEPKDIAMSLETISFMDLGLSSAKQTEALIFTIDKSNLLHDMAIKLIDKNAPVKNSIRMQYVKIDLAINSTDDEYKDEYKTWSECYPKLANPEKADELGYFWAVRELKIINEGSMVLQPSNDMTPIEVGKTTSEPEPPKSTRKTVTQMLQNVNV
jgi:hypothetical protein